MAAPSLHPGAGKPAPAELLIDLDRLRRAYHESPIDPAKPVSFGTSGHRGTPFAGTFTEAHVRAITQAICDHRAEAGITGPLFLGKDTHAISAAAEATALEVLAANGVEIRRAPADAFTPTPAVSRAILRHNHDADAPRADGIVITPSHNPPEDGGFKYNPPHGGPADSDVTGGIERRANEILRDGNRAVRRRPLEKAAADDPFLASYVEDLAGIIDFDVIRAAGLRLAVDPLGGASLPYWAPIRERYGLNLEIVNPRLDGRFGFMTLDHDGRIRMDCSSPWAMAGLLKLKDRFDLAFGTDPDADRHGIVTPSAGLMNPNAFLAVAIEYLLRNRPDWPAAARVGKTLVSSVMIDRVVAAAGRELCEVPVGFKWFAAGLFAGRLCFGGEESAGASFLRRDGTVWTTDKDGLVMGLLAAEITARTGADPGRHFARLQRTFGRTFYRRVDRDLDAAGKAALAHLSPEDVPGDTLAGAPITAKLTRAPGNGAPLGGLKVVTEKGWFAARPSGTEAKYKVYAESTESETHLDQLLREAEALVRGAIGTA
jgi:phosphoglucomutase